MIKHTINCPNTLRFYGSIIIVLLAMNSFAGIGQNNTFLRDDTLKMKSANDSIEFIISGVPNYTWYMNCRETANLMILAYWNDHGFPNLIPGGDSENGLYWAVLEQYFYQGRMPNAYAFHNNYYVQAAEYGNNYTSSEIFYDDITWADYLNLIDTYKKPLLITWDGPPYGRHALVGVGYKMVGSDKYLIVHDTWKNVSVYLEFDANLINNLTYWYISTEPEPVRIDSEPNNSSNDIVLTPTKLNFVPELSPQNDSYHHYVFADINGDGKKDIIATNFSSRGSRLYIYNYTDSGYLLDQSFQPNFQSTEYLNVAKAFDCDGDGDIDLTVTGGWAPVKLFINNGSGLNSNAIIIDGIYPDSFIDIDYGDYDKDGDLDLMASHAEGQLKIYSNNNGVFTIASILNTNDQNFKIQFVDLNKDSYPDIVTSMRNRIVNIYYNNKGVFHSSPDFSPAGHGGMSFAVGDINNSGWMDIVTVRDGELLIYSNQNGVFSDTPTTIASPECFPRDIILSNLDSDVFPELIVANFNRPNFILNNNNGHFDVSPSWISSKTEPTFSINILENHDTNNKLIGFGKSRGGEVEFYEIANSTALNNIHINRDKITINPNPANENITIQTECKAEQSMDIVILNPFGQTITLQSVRLQKGRNVIPFNISFLKPGLYFISLTNGNETYTQKLIKQ